MRGVIADSERRSKLKKFLIRISSGTILIALTILLNLPGGDITLLATSAISMLGLYELYKVIGTHKSPIMFAGLAAVICYFGNLRFEIVDSPMVIFVGFLIVLLFIMVICYPKYNAAQIGISYFGLFYVACMLSYIYQIRQMPGGRYIVWLVFLCTWGSDSAAYAAGSLLGRHKMAPVLSPKKSVEGAVGGVLGAMALTAIYVCVRRGPLEADTMKILVLVAIAGVAALISIVGDLAASAIKRNYDIKDYGYLIPGHGGILDRYDSVIIVAPIIYYLAYYLL